MRRRWFFWLGAISLAAIAALFFVSLAYYRSADLQRARGRISLYKSTLLDALEQFQHLPFVLSKDPFVISVAAGQDAKALNRRLAEFAKQSRLEAIYLMDTNGLVVAASNYDQPKTFLAQNYGFRPYFKDALAGRRGDFFGVGATTSRPGYFIAEPVKGPEGDMLGVIALKLDLSDLTNIWAAGGETVFVSNGDGVVVLSSDPRWLYHTLAPIPMYRLKIIAASRQFNKEVLTPLDWREKGADAAQLGERSYLHVTSPVARLGWTLHYFADESRIYERSWLTVVGASIVLSLLLAAAIFLRSERLRAALEASQAHRHQLQIANEDLRNEIEERQAAEKRLARAQSELARASNLAALGRLSASVTHELGQPISAMRNYLAAAGLDGEGLDGKEMIVRLGAIVERMENITKQLRFFAQPGETQMAGVDLREVVEGANELVAHDIKSAGVSLSLEIPGSPVVVRGNRLRLEQVVVNLMRNSIAAMEDSSKRKLSIVTGARSSHAFLTVKDSGHGLGDHSIEQLKEPFRTTRTSGRGMGLGLAITAAIVKEHDGHMTGHNGEPCGAVFTIQLPLDPGEQRV